MPARTFRVAIVGASSLRGKDLRELIAERSFPASDLRLIDDDGAAGTLTEAGGEPAFIQAMAEDSFAGVDFAFFAGRPEFTIRHWEQAARVGTTVVDLSGAFVDLRESQPWIPALDAVLPPPKEISSGKLFFSPPAATLVACTLAAALGPLNPARLSIVFFQPVSERGTAGIEELELQTVNLLRFQPISQTVYDAQVAFNLLGRFGAESREQLGGARAAISRGVARYLASRGLPAAAIPAVQLVQARCSIRMASRRTRTWPRRRIRRPWKRRWLRSGSVWKRAALLRATSVWPERVTSMWRMWKRTPVWLTAGGCGALRTMCASPRPTPCALRRSSLPLETQTEQRGLVAQRWHFLHTRGAVGVLFLFSIFSFLFSGLASCGYHVAGRGSELPAEWKTLAVPALENHTTRYRIEQRMTEALVRELLARTKYRVVPEETVADAVLRGEVVRVESNAVLFDAATGRATAMVVTVHMKVRLTDRASGKVHFQNDDFVFREQYEVSTDLSSFFEEQQPALDRMARDFAARLVSALLENF